MVSIVQFSLALLLVVVASSADVAAIKRQVTRNLQTYTQSDDYFTPMLERVNQERAAQGLSALCWSKKLQKAAQRMSDDMATNNFVGHTGSDGSLMGDRLKDAGYDGGASAENAEGGSPNVTAAMDDWMHSDGHRTNIMGDYTMMGAAYAYNADSSFKHYWTQDFGMEDSAGCDDIGGMNSGSDQVSLSGSENTPQSQSQTPATPPTVTPVETTAPATTMPATSTPRKHECKTKM